MSSSPFSISSSVSSLFSRQGWGSPSTLTGLESDENPIQSIWLDVLKRISTIGKQSPHYIVSIPFPLGVLFCELLGNRHEIKKITADKPDRLTILFFNSLTKLGKCSSTGFVQPYLETPADSVDYGLSPRSLEKKTASISTEFPNYLQKFLEISELMYQNFQNKVYVFTVPVEGFDLQFLKSAVWHHYPQHFSFVKTKKNKDKTDALEFFLRDDISNLSELARKIDRLRTVAQEIGACDSYSLPDSHLSCESSLWDKSGKGKILSGSHSGPQRFLGERYVEPMMISPSQFHRLADESDISDLEMNFETQNDHANWMAAQLNDLVEHELHGAMPKSYNSSKWRGIWKKVKLEGVDKKSISKRQLFDLVKMQRDLFQSTFDLMPSLTSNDEKLSKFEQMKSICEGEIIRSYFPDEVIRPIVDLELNGCPLIFNTISCDENLKNSQEFFGILLSELLRAQERYNEQDVKQLLSDLFHKQSDIHETLPLDTLILAMLQAATVGFEANVVLLLKELLFSQMEEKYKIKYAHDRVPLCEFFTNSHGNCEVIRTSAFALYNENEEIGVLVTRLISSFPKDLPYLSSYSIEIPYFQPSSSCSLLKQKEICRALLRGSQKSNSSKDPCPVRSKGFHVRFSRYAQPKESLISKEVY